MLNITNVSMYAFRVALRWALIKGYPEMIDDWTQEQSDTIQNVANEVDRRHVKRLQSPFIKSFRKLDDA